jgi:hypothetical protein
VVLIFLSAFLVLMGIRKARKSILFGRFDSFQDNLKFILNSLKPFSTKWAFCTILACYSIIFFGIGEVNGQCAVTVPAFTTPGSNTWTVPAGVTSITVEVWGAGGRGGSRTSGSGAYGGGGGGAYSRRVISVTSGQNYTYEVGAGSSSNAAGATGGISRFYLTSSPTIDLVRAAGGNSVGNNSVTGALGGSAATGIGDITYSGGNGANATTGNNSPSTNRVGGGGGSSAGTSGNGNNATGLNGATAPIGGGDGGDGINGNGNGENGFSPGGGGGGAERTSGTRTGGNGGNGQIIISYTLPANTVSAASSSPTACVGTAITAISHTTTGATGIGTATGLPAGVTASWAANTITISGTPTASGTFNYSIPMTGGCTTGQSPATGTITVNPRPTPTFSVSPSSPVCPGSPVTYTTQTGNSNYLWSVPGTLGIDYSITAGSLGTSSNSVTLTWLTSGSKTVTVNYTNSNGCASSTPASNTLTVNPNTSITGQSTAAQTVCLLDPFSPISVTATGTGTLTYQWYSNTVSSNSGGTAISGATAASFTPPSNVVGTRYYYVVVSSSCGPAQTSAISGAFTVDDCPCGFTETSPGTYPFVVPTGVIDITIEAWGGGGRGGSRTTDGVGGGGGGGAYSRSVLSVNPGDAYTYIVGQGSSTTTAGGNSRFYSNSAPSTDLLRAMGGNSAANNNFNGATGGAASGGIGAIRYSGGNGASGSSDGGGGGSSAGTTANGVTATSPTGAIAPSGGGNGGGGNTALFSGNGTNGSFPGGGGGGAKRVLVNSPTGGIGGNGQVIISFRPTPTFTTQPGASVCQNQEVTYTTQSGADASNYIWTVSGAEGTDYNITSGNLGTSSSSVTLEWLTTGSKTVTVNYTVTAYGSSCQGLNAATSNITVTPITSIVTQPSSTDPSAVCQGGTFPTLTVVAAGTAPYSYQWYSNSTASTTGPDVLPVGTDSPSFTPSSATPGTLYYYAVVTGACGPPVTTDFSGAHTVNPLTEITTQPIGATYCQGDSPAALTVAATGTGTITYEWFQNSSNTTVGGVSVGSDPTYLPSTSNAGILYYYAVATSPTCGSVTSDVVAVEINPETLITSQPTGATYCQFASPVELSIAATGTGAISYEWFQNTSNSTIGGVSVGSDPTYLPSTANAGTLYYYAIATGACGSATSSVIAININPETVITTQPIGNTYCQDAAAVALSVAGAGTGTITYEWFQNTSNSTTGGVSVGSNPTYVPPTSSAGTLYYYAVVTSATCGSLASDVVAIEVNPETLISTQPLNAIYCQYDSPIALSVEATGTGTITYEWFQNSVNSTVGGVSVGSNSTYSPSTVSAGTFYYYAIATGDCGIATSNVVEVVINPETTIDTQPSNTNQTQCIGGSFTALEVLVSGTGPFTYQWYSNSVQSNSGGTLISGATSSSYTPLSTNEGTSYYYAEVISGCSTLTSAPSGLFTVNPNTSIDSENLSGQIICDGANFTSISITASGTGTLNYQWFSNTSASITGGTPVGTNSPSYTPASSSIGTLYYYVEVTGDCGPDVTSSLSGPFTVNPITQITTQPDTSGEVECFGDGFDPISVSAIGANLTYQWYSNSTASSSGGTAVPGATLATFTPPSTVLGSNFYYVIVTGSCGNETSSVSGEYIVTPPITTITQDPSNANETSCVGGSFSELTISAIGEGTVTYQWYANLVDSNTGGTTIPGATGTNFTPPTTTPGTLYYYATASSDCGTVPTGVSGAFTVTPLTAITSESIAAQTICDGDSFSPISVVADGTAPITFQWYSNTTATTTGPDVTLISGANSDTYTPASTAVGTLYYFVEVSSNCGSDVVSSISGAFTVNPITTISIQPEPSSPPAVCQGGVFPDLSVSASGTGTLRYQWYSNTSNSTSGPDVMLLTGETADSFTPPSSASGDLYYFVVVGSDCGPDISSSVSGLHTVNPLTTITTQPTGVIYCEGDSAIPLTVDASGTGTLSYEWFSNSTNSTVGGSSVGTNINYTPPTGTPGTLYYYVVVISPTCGSTTSDVVTVSVNPETVITTNPIGATYCEGDVSTALSISATGTGTISYEWFTNSVNSAVGGTSVGSGPTFLPSTTTPGTQYYYAIASGDCGDATSTVVAITVNPNTNISVQPVGATYCEGESATALSVTASGSGTLTYEWFSNSVNSTTGGVSVGSNANYTPTTGTPGTQYYYVEVTGDCGIVTSDIVAVIINPETVITTQPTGASYCQDDTATSLNINASGAGTITYEWFQNAVNSTTGGVSVGSNQTYTPSTSLSGTNYYYAIATSSVCGTAVSNVIAVTITPTNTVTAASSSPELCINTSMTSITHGTTGANGIVPEDDDIDYNLPNGVTATWASSTLTISGTPTEVGTFNYSIPLAGGCGTVNATGTITVTNPSYPISGINVVNPELGDPTPATSSITVFSPGLTPGNYTVQYSTAGVNAVANQTISVTVTTAGEFSFTTLPYSIEGTTVLRITSIQKETDICPFLPNGNNTILYGISCSNEFDRVDGNKTFYVPANVSELTIQVFGNGSGGNTALETIKVIPTGTIFIVFSGSDVFATEVPPSEPLAVRLANAIVSTTGPNGKVKMNFICSTISPCLNELDNGNTTIDSEGFTVIRIDNTSGPCNWTAPQNLDEFEVLVVGGGGGGGRGTAAGGGGGGNVVYQQYTGITTGSEVGLVGATFTINVGAAGTGAPNNNSTRGSDGSTTTFSGPSFSFNSSQTFSDITASGGGGGGTTNNSDNTIRSGRNGGSGGGAAVGWNGLFGTSIGNEGTGTGPNGNNGGAGNGFNFFGATAGAGGGGGGAGGAGGNGSTSLGAGGGIGGAGIEYTISGQSTFYAAGGGGTSTGISFGNPGAGGSSGAGGAGNNGGTGEIGTTYGSGGGAGSAGGGAGFQGVVYIRYPNFRILPVEFLYFSAKYNPGFRSGDLTWATAKEWENDRFEIERSVNDVKSWETIGEVAGAGYSDKPVSYTYQDLKLPLAGGTIFYRLKQINFNGDSAYSDTKAIQVEAMAGTTYWRVYPNPTSGDPINLEMLDTGVYNDEEITVRVIAATGQFEILKGTSQSLLSSQLSNILRGKAAGIYTVEISWSTFKEYHKVILRR